MMVEMVVQAITRDERSNSVVLLKEKEGARAVPIMIGPWEAQAIACHLQGLQPQRPLTHDLMLDIVQQLDFKVARVLVNDLRERVFYALLVLVNNGREEQVDARPSDAIALAVRAGAPIYVAEKIIAEAGSSGLAEAQTDVTH